MTEQQEANWANKKQFCTICEKEIVFPDTQYEEGLDDRNTGHFIFFYACKTCAEKSYKCEFWQDLVGEDKD